MMNTARSHIVLLSLLLVALVMIQGLYLILLNPITENTHQFLDSLPDEDARSISSTANHINNNNKHQDQGQEEQNQQQQQQPPIKIAYAVTVSKCESLQSDALQSAPLLAHHIHAMSCRNQQNNGADTIHRSKYDYHLFALASKTQVIPECVNLLEQFGYEVLLLDLPINETLITNKPYLTYLHTNGCCGAHEFIKLYAYTLTKYPLVIHLDLDTMLLQPLDDLIDSFILEGEANRNVARSKLQIMRPTQTGGKTNTIQAMFTRDYQQVFMALRASTNYKHIPIQGGFFAVVPNQTVFDILIDMVHTANYTITGGWGGIMHTTSCWGDPQIQGLLGYYYSFIQPDQGLELHNCYYNNILSEPIWDGTCIPQVEPCIDCRKVPPQEVKLSHPIFCHKPWSCPRWEKEGKKHFPRATPCRWYLNKWYLTRKQVEEGWSMNHQRKWNKTVADGEFMTDIFLGYCHENKTFIPMDFSHYG